MKICLLSSPQHSVLLGLSLSLTSSPSHKLLLCLLCSGLLTGLPVSILEPSVAPTFLQRSQDKVAQILSFPCFKSFNDILLQLEKLPSPCEDLKMMIFSSLHLIVHISALTSSLWEAYSGHPI